MSDIKWLPEPEAHDWDAADKFLRLLNIEAKVQAVHGEEFRARDILRAAQLPALPKDEKHVAHDIDKIRDGTPLSPVLLMLADPTIIADGYHRICAVYHEDEDAFIPCWFLAE